MHIAAVAWLARASGRSLASRVRSAWVRSAGLPVSSTLLASARDARQRDRASRMTGPISNHLPGLAGSDFSWALGIIVSSLVYWALAAPQRPEGSGGDSHIGPLLNHSQQVAAGPQ